MSDVVRRPGLILLIVLAVAAVIALQSLVTWRASERAQAILAEISTLDPATLSNEKTRTEIAQARIETELDRFFWHSLISNLIPLGSVAVALLGAWIGLRKYLDEREKERLDRGANDLTQVLEYLADADNRKRTVGLVGLQHFFSPDKSEYHLRALSALAAGARLETDDEVLRALRLAMEQAAANVEPGLLRQVPWQNVKLGNVDLSNRTLDGLDLRDTVLEDSNLAGAKLRGAKLVNAKLNGARLTDAELQGADLTYADLAGADLEGADLRGAVLHEAKVLRMNLKGADLRGAVFDPGRLRWDLIENWREATLDDGLMERLVARYGPASAGPRVLMLLWEMPPLVAGGTWTATYHLVRNLKRSGARVTVAIPWVDWALTPLPFDTDVPVVALGIDPPRAPAAGGGGPYWSPYASPGWSPYAPTGWSAYGYGAPAWSPYGSVSGWPYGPYGGIGATTYGRAPGASAYHEGSGLLRLMDDFRRRVARLVARERFDLVHAHDWVTFPAAMEAARVAGIPWTAHFHSTEGERHPGRPDPVVEHLEREAARNAGALVAPSRSTAGRLAEVYGVEAARIHAVPNCLSPEEVPLADMGGFETRRVVFLGRLARQKGPDLFARIAEEVLKTRPGVTFVAHGEGEEAPALYRSPVRVLGPVDWRGRGSAFRGASAILVPSRAEPFGMVILEAMQHNVPVLYAAGSGAAEVLESGVQIDPEDAASSAARLIQLLDDWLAWERTVEAQSREIRAYPKRGYERELAGIWSALHAAARGAGGPAADG